MGSAWNEKVIAVSGEANGPAQVACQAEICEHRKLRLDG